MTDWHEFDVRVYYEDTDAQGVVYFANYLKFMERARTEWLRALGVEQDQLLEDHGLCFTLTETNAKFIRPARFNEHLQVRTRITRVRAASIMLEQVVWRYDHAAGADELLCQAGCIVACIDAESFTPRRIPTGLLEKTTVISASRAARC